MTLREALESEEGQALIAGFQANIDSSWLPDWLLVPFMACAAVTGLAVIAWRHNLALVADQFVGAIDSLTKASR